MSHWIQKAIKPSNKGIFVRAAKRHGLSTSAFANEVLAHPDKYREKTVRRARLAKTLIKLRK